MVVCIIFLSLFVLPLAGGGPFWVLFGGVDARVEVSATSDVVLGLYQANNVPVFPFPHATGHNATSPSTPRSHSPSYKNSTTGVGSVPGVLGFRHIR